jgi:hypothetical protein
MATQVVVAKQFWFQKNTPSSTWYYVVANEVSYTEKDIYAELKKHGYINIETRYAVIAWP